MNYVYLFDVDGTLTPPRQPMDAGFSKYFDGFTKSNKVVLVSGSDYNKIQEQIPHEILKNCSGAEYFEEVLSG